MVIPMIRLLLTALFVLYSVIAQGTQFSVFYELIKNFDF